MGKRGWGTLPDLYTLELLKQQSSLVCHWMMQGTYYSPGFLNEVNKATSAISFWTSAEGCWIQRLVCPITRDGCITALRSEVLWLPSPSLVALRSKISSGCETGARKGSKVNQNRLAP